MTNHDMFVETFRGREGQIFSTKQIIFLCSAKFLQMEKGSMLPNDHAQGNKSACRCARTSKRIFDRIKRGVYKVRPNLQLMGLP